MGRAAKGSATDIVRRALGKPASVFGGTYRLMCGGKLGEVFFAAALLRDLRGQLPRARIVLDCWPGYAFVANSLRQRFDAVECSHSSLYCRGGIYKARNEVAMSLFRGSPIFPGKLSVSAPFYKVFARSAGARSISIPTFAKGAPQEPLALALPTMNRNASARGRLPFDADGWAQLAEELRAAGLRPVATGASRDGAPKMPGWHWANGGRQDVVQLVQRAQVVIGGNSGIVFMAGAMGKDVVMLNDIDNSLSSWWDPRGMTDVPGLAAIRYLRLSPRGDTAAALPFTLNALGAFRRARTPARAPATGARTPRS